MNEGGFHPTNPTNCSWLTYGKLWNDTMPIRIIYALDRAGKFINFNLLSNDLTDLYTYFIFTRQPRNQKPRFGMNGTPRPK